jgi:hypothetical protein
MRRQSPQEPSIVFLVDVDELIHTDDYPFCPDGSCPCHGDQTWCVMDSCCLMKLYAW